MSAEDYRILIDKLLSKMDFRMLRAAYAILNRLFCQGYY